MPKSQFSELVSKITSSTSPILPHKISYGDSVKLQTPTPKQFYNSITKLCQLESLDVLCINTS
jgi:hypothetical protein